MEGPLCAAEVYTGTIFQPGYHTYTSCVLGFRVGNDFGILLTHVQGFLCFFSNMVLYGNLKMYRDF